MVGGNCLSGRLVYLLLSTDRSTKFEKVDGQIFMQKSKSFVYILLGLLAVRLLLHGYIERHISIPQTAALFFMLAYGMIVTGASRCIASISNLRHQERLYSGHVPS